jgi:hypothetical protein
MQVKFLYNQENQDLFVIFPTDTFKGAFGDKLCTCYSSGQHSTCSMDYVQESKEADEIQYKSLLNELIQIGYMNLEIV